MPAAQYIVNALVAAALGAGTNELAIVCILRYILPRKKGEIARRIRDLVATDLLSPEKMRRKIDDPRVGELLDEYFVRGLGEMAERDLPPPREIVPGGGEALDRMAERARESLLSGLSRRLADPAAFRGHAVPVLRGLWREWRDRTPASFLADPAAPPRALGNWLESLSDSATLKNGVRGAVRALLDAEGPGPGGPPGAMAAGAWRAAGDFAARQAPALVDMLAAVLHEPRIRDALADAVMASIRDQFRGQGLLGGLKGAVVDALNVERDVKGVVARLPEALRRHFSDPENLRRLAESASRAAGTVAEREIAAALGDPKRRERLADRLVEFAWMDETFRAVGEKAADIAGAVMERPLRATAMRVGIDPDDEAALADAAEAIRRALSSPSTGQLAAAQFDALYQTWKNRPLGRVARFVPEETLREAALALSGACREMLSARLAEFAERSGVWDVITESVEEYDDLELARMIRRLAHRELRWVTILGGAIGLVVGILQTLLAEAV